VSGVQIGPRDALHPSRISMYVLIGWAVTAYHRPYLPDFLPSYSAFTNVMPWPLWGYAGRDGAAAPAARATGDMWRLIAHAWSAHAQTPVHAGRRTWQRAGVR
ncbi:hypothetical protein CTI14_43840, partial [Methylobacterium radiotolerans]